MTSSRGQNVSIFQHPGSERWKPPVTSFTDTGGSFADDSRNISLSLGRNASATEKNSDHHLFKSSSTGAYTNPRKKDNSFTSNCTSVLMTNSVNSSSVLNPANRELSPVRWCDRKVDGVYLGRSGWVQVQQRSLDDSKAAVYFDNNGFSTLQCRKHFSDIDSNLSEGREYNRPLNLLLPTKKRTVRQNYERPSKFIQEFESISPPSITPIISPPPAFKDDGSNVEFPRQSIRKPFHVEESFLLGSKGSSCPPRDRHSTLQSSRTEIWTGSKQERLSYRTSQTKSLEDDVSNRICRNRRCNSAKPFPAIGFRSLDNDAATTGSSAIKVSDGDSFYKSFEKSTENLNCGECDEKERLENCNDEEAVNSNGYYLGLRNSSKEDLNGQKNSSKAFRQRNYQRNGRRTLSSYRTRSSSSDSSTSSSNFSGKNSEKVPSSRRTNSKEKQIFEFENSSCKNGKQFHVKRSRSLQLSEKRSPSESTLNHSSSGKSWDPMPPEYLTFQVANQSRGSPVRFPQHSHHVLVTVNGDSIPVGNPGNLSLKSLSKITTSEEEQKKLILEAEKEARIIAEFLSGTRSRTAARNLLMHRYLNRNGDLGSLESSENLPPKAEHEAYFLEADRRENYWKKNKPNSSANAFLRQHSKTVYSTPLTSFFRASNICNRAGDGMLPQNVANPRKKERIEIKGSSEFSELYSADRPSKKKNESINRLLEQACENSAVEKLPLRLLDEKQKPQNEILDGNPEVLKGMLKNGPRISSAKKPMPTEAGNLVESSSISSSSTSSSSSSPSSSPDICRIDFGGKFIKRTKDTSSLFEDLSLGGNSDAALGLRSDCVPECDDFIAAGVDQRSLSLPRSFLSDCYRLNYSDRRKSPRWKQHDEETLEENIGELLLNSQRSRTAPTTPTHDLRYGKSTESLSQNQCSSRTSLLDESSLPNPRRIARKFTQEKPGRSAPNDVNTSDGSAFLIYKSSHQLSENSAETVLHEFKKKLPPKYLKSKGNFENFNECSNNGIENVENSCETIVAARRSMSGLQVFRNEDRVPEKALRCTKEQSGRKKSLKNEQYDSHDSGIQMGNRGNVDSSESQDTDLQEDIDSPLLVRKRGSQNLYRTESEIFTQTLSDQLKADIQWRSKIKKHNYDKGVRRTSSDAGGQKFFNLDVRNPSRSSLFATDPSPARDRHAKTTWGLVSPEGTAIRHKFAGTQLRRSLSQPLGLNELPPFSRSSTFKCLALSEDEKNPRGKTSEDECLSDSESSVASLQERKKSFESAPRTEATILAEAVWDHVAIESCELPFRAGDVIEVLDTQNWDWWWGATAENRGYFPSAFVRLRVNQEDTVEDCLAAMAKGKGTSDRLRRGKSVSLLSNDQVRSSVVRELLNTEQDFVKILRDLKDGYVEQCKRRTDMFTSAQIATIFSNLEDLLDFQEKFLKDLEASVDVEFPYNSCIGKVFLTHGSGFRMYSEYCNSHPMAMATLQDLYQKNGYCKFFETCRLKQSLIEIPLDGYLLTPVQRICKYPLQLAELLKYTKPDHPDFREVQEALETMRAVATLINERKRKMESLEKLAAWQQRVEGWEGEDLIEISSRLIHQGDVVRITSGVWTSNITLFLFDHQIVYCKKDLLKRNVYIYKGRIFLDASVVVDVPDGKNQQLGVTVKYGLKICSNLKDKWLLFCCRSSEDKAKWLDALAEEKRLVAQDRDVGLDLPPTAKRLAKMAARTKKCPPCKPRGKNKFASNHEDMSFRSCHPGASKSKSSRRVGTWFTFGGVIKNSKTSLRPRTTLHRIT